jgi:hypothetical protein
MPNGLVDTSFGATYDVAQLLARGSNPMAKQYGTPIKPYEGDALYIDNMAEHTGWSKSQVIQHMVAKTYDMVMNLPGAPKPGSD